MRGGPDSCEDFSGKKGNGYGHSNSDFFNRDGAMGNGSSILVDDSGGLGLSKNEKVSFGSVVHHTIL